MDGATLREITPWPCGEKPASREGEETKQDPIRAWPENIVRQSRKLWILPNMGCQILLQLLALKIGSLSEGEWLDIEFGLLMLFFLRRSIDSKPHHERKNSFLNGINEINEDFGCCVQVMTSRLYF